MVSSYYWNDNEYIRNEGWLCLQFLRGRGRGERREGVSVKLCFLRQLSQPFRYRALGAKCQAGRSFPLHWISFCYSVVWRKCRNCMKGSIINLLNDYQAGYTPIMMAALAGVVKEDDKDIARKLFQTGDVNKQVEEVSSLIRLFSLRSTSAVIAPCLGLVKITHSVQVPSESTFYIDVGGSLFMWHHCEISGWYPLSDISSNPCELAQARIVPVFTFVGANSNSRRNSHLTRIYSKVTSWPLLLLLFFQP